MATRRVFLAALLSGCSRAEPAVRLHARPVAAPSGDPKAGTTPLHLRAERDALLYVPASLPDPAPLLLYLHGATGSEQQGIRRLSGLADEFERARRGMRSARGMVRTCDSSTSR